MQLHIEATDMAAVLNNGNYSALLGFVQGNMVEVSSYAQARPAPPVPEEPRTTFNADLKFDAPAGDRPNFYMTIAAPSLAVSSQAKCSLHARCSQASISLSLSELHHARVTTLTQQYLCVCWRWHLNQAQILGLLMAYHA